MQDYAVCCRQKKQHQWPYVVDKQGHATELANIAAIVKAVEKKGEYFMCNLYCPADMSSLHQDIRSIINLRKQHASTEWWEHTYHVQDAARSTLYLVGNKNNGTGFHADWSETKNISWAINGTVCYKLLIQQYVPRISDCASYCEHTSSLPWARSQSWSACICLVSACCELILCSGLMALGKPVSKCFMYCRWTC